MESCLAQKAVNSELDFRWLAQSVINDKCTSQGLANGAATALKPRPALCQMARVAFTRLRRTQRSPGRVPFPASCSPGRQSQPAHAVSALSVCRCGARASPQCPLLGNPPRVTSRQLRLPFQPQPARMIRSSDSSYLDFCSKGVGLRSAAKIKPVTWHGHGKALGSFGNNKGRVCPASAPSQETSFVGCWIERGLPAAEADRPDLPFREPRGSGVLCESSSHETARNCLQLTHQTPRSCSVLSLPTPHSFASRYARGVSEFCPFARSLRPRYFLFGGLDKPGLLLAAWLAADSAPGYQMPGSGRRG